MQEGDTAHPRSPTSQAGEPPGPQDRSRGTCVSPLPRAGYRICGPGAQSKRGSTFLFPSIPRPVMVAFVCSTKSRSLVQGYLRGQHRTSQTRAQGGRGASPGEGGSWDHVRPSCPLHSHSPSRQTCLPNGRFKDKNLTDPTMVTVGLYASSAGPFCARSPVPRRGFRRLRAGLEAEDLETPEPQGDIPAPPRPGPGWAVASWPRGPKVPTYHPPPEGVRVAAELDLARLVHGVLLGQVHEVGGEDEAQEADVQGGDQLLGDSRGGVTSRRPRAAGALRTRAGQTSQAAGPAGNKPQHFPPSRHKCQHVSHADIGLQK